MNVNPSVLVHAKRFNISQMAVMKLWSKMDIPSTLIAIIFRHTIRKNLIFFPYLRHYHSTPSLLNNTDTESYQEFFSNPPQNESDSPLEYFNPTLFLKRSQKHQRKLYPIFAYQKLHNFLPPNNNLDVFLLLRL